MPAEARRRRLLFADATCPLVSKVHREVERHHKAGRTVLLIGHAGHPEVIGTMGQVAPGLGAPGRDRGRCRDRHRARPDRLAYSTQTTLVARRHGGDRRGAATPLPGIDGPRNEDICYATTNRQTRRGRDRAARRPVPGRGAANSSNSVRLVEVARNTAPAGPS